MFLVYKSLVRCVLCVLFSECYKNSKKICAIENIGVTLCVRPQISGAMLIQNAMKNLVKQTFFCPLCVPCVRSLCVRVAHPTQAMRVVAKRPLPRIKFLPAVVMSISFSDRAICQDLAAR